MPHPGLLWQLVDVIQSFETQPGIEYMQACIPDFVFILTMEGRSLKELVLDSNKTRNITPKYTSPQPMVNWTKLVNVFEHCHPSSHFRIWNWIEVFKLDFQYLCISKLGALHKNPSALPTLTDHSSKNNSNMGNLDDFFVNLSLTWVNILQISSDHFGHFHLRITKESLHGAEPFGVGGKVQWFSRLKKNEAWLMFYILLWNF